MSTDPPHDLSKCESVLLLGSDGHPVAKAKTFQLCPGDRIRWRNRVWIVILGGRRPAVMEEGP
jgi:hypothetical protein